jgi:hypothetical protein
MTRVADGMACGRLNHLDEASACVCALVYRTSWGGQWVGVNLKVQNRPFSAQFAGVPFAHNHLVVAAARCLDGCNKAMHVSTGE